MKRLASQMFSFAIATTGVVLGLFSCGLVCPPAHGQDAAPGAGTDEWAISLAWADDNTLLYTASSGSHFRPGSVKRLDTSSGTVETIGEGECSLWALTKIGPEAYAACDYRGKLYTISDTVEKSSLQLSWARAMTTIGDGRVAVATQDGTVAIIDFAQEKVIVQRELHQSQVFEIRFDADKDEFLTCDAGGNIIRSKVASLEPLASLSLGGESLWTAARVGERIVAGGSARTVEVADEQLSQRLLAVNSTSDWVSGSVHVGSSDLALLSTLGGTIEAFDIKKMHRISSTQVVESGIWDCKISPNGKTLAIATRKHGVQLVDVAPLIAAAHKAATAAERLLPPQPK